MKSVPSLNAAALCVLMAGLGFGPASHGQTVYSMGVSLDGDPGALIRAEDGSFYGVLSAGGRAGLGSIIHLSADARTRETVFDFSDATTNQTLTAGPLAAVTNGAIYGAFTDFPPSGGTNVFYCVGTNSTGFRRLQGLPAFYNSLFLASDQRFYLISGSRLDRFDQNGSGYMTLTNGLNWSRFFEGGDASLYAVAGSLIQRLNKDGSGLVTLTNLARGVLSLTWAGDGRLYGTEDNFPNGAVAFALNADGTGLQVLGNLDSAGQDSTTGALLDRGDGKLYTIFQTGPLSSSARIVSIQKAGGVSTVLNLPAMYANNPGAQNLALGLDGLLYGCSSQGGTNRAGAMYVVDPSSGILSDRLQFGGNPGSFVQSALIFASDHRLYGTARQGGANGNGIVFRLNPDGSGFTVLKDFVSAAEGVSPRSGLIEGADGVLYGTTEEGGNTGGGTVFKINKDATGFVVLAQLSATTGTNSVAQLLQATDGALYGTCLNGGTTATNGTIWTVPTNGTGLVVLKRFAASGSEGRHPFAPLIEGADGLCCFGKSA